MSADLLDRPEDKVATMPPAKKESPAKAPKPAEVLTARVAEKYPECEGWKRKIHHLWGNFFRINYFNLDNEIKIESAFVEVLPQDIIVHG